MVWNGKSDSDQGGVATVSLSAAATGTVAVVFTPQFSTTPRIKGLVVAGTNAYLASVPSGLSASGMTIGVRHWNGTTATTDVLVHWEVGL